MFPEFIKWHDINNVENGGRSEKAFQRREKANGHLKRCQPQEWSGECKLKQQAPFHIQQMGKHQKAC